MTYIDGFVVPVPNGKKEAYRELSARVAPIFKEYGALRVVECWGDDVPDGKVTDFKRAVEGGAGRKLCVFLDTLAVESRTRCGQQENHVRPANGPRLRHAVRRQAPYLWRI